MGLWAIAPGWLQLIYPKLQHSMTMEILLPSHPIFYTSTNKNLQNLEQSISLISDSRMAPQCLQDKAQTPSQGFHTRHVITKPSFPFRPLASPYHQRSQGSFLESKTHTLTPTSLQEIAWVIASPLLSNSYFVLQVLAVSLLGSFSEDGRLGSAFLYACMPPLLALNSML